MNQSTAVRTRVNTRRYTYRGAIGFLIRWQEHDAAGQCAPQSQSCFVEGADKARRYAAAVKAGAAHSTLDQILVSL